MIEFNLDINGYNLCKASIDSNNIEEASEEIIKMIRTMVDKGLYENTTVKESIKNNTFKGWRI